MIGSRKQLAGIAVVLCGGCATIPSGPSSLVLPGTGKDFEHFRVDDAICRQFAHEQVAGITPGQAASESVTQGAVVGTVLGAAAGAAFGAGSGAAIGAGSGLLVGSAAGYGAGDTSAYAVQRRYDFGYQQCMYAKGNKIPVTGRFITAPPQTSSPPPPPSSRRPG